jgi:hypothetical protein
VLFGDNNTDLSIPIGLKNKLNLKYNLCAELFGSAINTSYKYCSMNYDVEKYFGSLGNFFKYEDYDGHFYTANPPF